MDRIALFLSVVLLTTFSWARTPLTDQEAADLINQFQYQDNFNELESRKSGRACWIYTKTIETQYPGASEPMEIDITMYMPNRDKLRGEIIPAVIMLPPTGGINVLDKKMGKSFCKNKTAAIIIENDFANIVYQAKKELLPPEDHEESYYRATAGVKATMAMIKSDSDLDPQKIGIFGVSLGGILGAFVMSTQQELAAGYFIVAGGDVPYILSVSQQDEVSQIRRKRMREEGFSTKQEYENYLRSYISFDPLDLSRTMTPETLSMVISKKDTTVPTATQANLHQAYGEPDVRYSNSGHVGTVINSLFFAGGRRRVTQFFDKRFKLKNPRPISFQWLNQFSLAHYM